MNYDFNVFYYLKLLKKWWKALVIIVSISMFLTMGKVLLKPTTYVSTITLLMMGETNANTYVGHLLGVGTLSLPNFSRDLIVGILTSNRMDKDVREQFKSYDKNFWWKVETYPVSAGLNIYISGPDPALTEKIANFCIQNLDKINTELDLTPTKPMVKVLDSPGYGVPANKQVLRKMFIAGIFSFLALCFYIFFMDYFKKLKRHGS